MKRPSRGFSLMELMVVLTLAGVILGLGAPSFNRFRQNSRMTNTANDVLTSIVKARTEAIKRQATVSMCASADPLTAAATCSDGATQGFIVFVDTNSDCLWNGTEERLDARAYDHSMSNNPLLVRADGNCISYGANGFMQNISGRTRVTRMLYCDSRNLNVEQGTTNSAARGIMIETTGRARVTRDVTSSFASNMTTWSITCP